MTIKNIFFISNKIICILILLLLSSCKSKTEKISLKSTNYQEIRVDIEKDIVDSKELFKLIDSISFVRLETNPQFLIGKISKVLFDKKSIYILDKNSNAVYKFDLAGKGILKFGKVGKGPGEYAKIGDFTVSDDKIIIFDRTNKFLFYDKKGGFIKEEYIDVYPKHIGALDKNYLVSFNRISKDHFSNTRITLFKEGKKEPDQLKNQELVQPYKNLHINLGKPVAQYNEEILLTEYLKNDIYGITKDSVFIKYRFNFGQYSLTEGIMDSYKNLTINEFSANSSFKDKDYVTSLDYFNETKDYVYISPVWKGYAQNLFYNKKKNKSYNFPYKSFPLWFQKIFRTYIGTLKENTFVSVIQAHQLEALDTSEVKEIKENATFHPIIKLKNKINEDDNPMLMLTHMK